MPERNPFIRGLRSWVGYRQIAIPYQRRPRLAGRSKYSLRRLIGLALDGILGSSTLPLRFATYFGALVSVLAMAGAVFTLVLRLFPAPFAVLGFRALPGTASIVISILFLGGVQLLCLGIIGEYIGRIFENVKARPHWTIEQTVGISREIEDSILLAGIDPPAEPTAGSRSPQAELPNGTPGRPA